MGACLQVREALASKVSKERVGTELEGMFKGPDPVRAVADIQRLRLFPVVFAAPQLLRGALGDDYGAPCATLLAEAAALIETLHAEEPMAVDERRLALLAAMLLPLRACETTRDGSKPTMLTHHIVLESIKWKRKDAEAVSALHAAAAELLHDLSGGLTGAGENLRVQLGRVLRRLGKLGLVRPGIVLAPLLTHPEAAPLGVDPAVAHADSAEARSASPEALRSPSSADEGRAARLETCRLLEAAMEAFGLSECWNSKPLLTGKEVMGLLGLKGKEVGEAMEHVTDWQLAHPSETAAECREWLAAKDVTAIKWPHSYCQGWEQLMRDALPGRHHLLERHHSADYITPEPANKTYISVYSALHDPQAGEVRVFSEVHPREACTAAATCRLQGTGVDVSVAARVDMPFSALLEKDIPEPLECFHTCLLPTGSESAQLASVTVLSKTSRVVLSQRVERIEVLGAHKKSVGICTAPVFTDVPQYLDWVDHHRALGVEGFHLYAVIMDLSRARDALGRGRPGHKKRLTVQQSHRVRWHTRHVTDYDLPSHYFGQAMLTNDCLYRHRQTYEFLLFLDRDEFLHFVDTPPRAVNLAWEFHSRLSGTNRTSLAFMSAVYRVHCLVAYVPDLAERPVHRGADAEVEPQFAEPYQVYKGYSIWQTDARKPNFSNCTSVETLAGNVPASGRQCHSKSVVRPLTVDFMGTHSVVQPRASYSWSPMAFHTDQAFLKHLRCMADRHGWMADESASLCERGLPGDSSVLAGDEVEVCPGDP
ncbi:hypothetical protein COCSUDRAFT_56588 [Coccomyxa subellipsoidea C-169]|uniref:Glycosyltransferase family 92 protein n=1 Tax=Coccomyxa subellipsoidea (strain C-169) TaxID=574566 RepID=I0YSK0_COCSC|nr:hypothetical protein COCSUDRAFT_56588 [Coccomyxa subellipsoidea C-169]EIE21369.1 hypothetical protein COCSUDRAFT_56588 [Coccomyxa subellipsoidea C-169]|eukprot:XP_005645913.1 hypothetical protein COCSUDRAFT_56588 [Coccomyxa subellipsoidea C-169]